MALLDAIIGPLAGLIDKVVPDPKAREAAKLELLRLEGSHELERIKAQMAAVLAEAGSADPWTSRARPSFLYVMYVLLLWSIPMGIIAAIRPGSFTVAADLTSGDTKGRWSISWSEPEPQRISGARPPSTQIGEPLA